MDKINSSSDLLDDWLDADELATAFNLSPDTLKNWRSRGYGPVAVKVGKRVLYRRGAVIEWLKSEEERASRSHGRAR